MRAHSANLTFVGDGPRSFLETFTFPEIQNRGVFIIELIGGELRSRALVRRGSLIVHEAVVENGHVVKVFDEESQPLPTAHVWMEGTVYNPEQNGIILLPFRPDSSVYQKLLVRCVSEDLPLTTLRVLISLRAISRNFSNFSTAMNNTRSMPESMSIASLWLRATPTLKYFCAPPYLCTARQWRLISSATSC